MKIKNKKTREVFSIDGTYFHRIKCPQGVIYRKNSKGLYVKAIGLTELMTDYEPVDNAIVDFNPIAVSKLAGVEIADKNYTQGDKQHFTFDEALEIEKQLKGTGWRLPTRKEWALICEEFACDDDGELNAQLLVDKLKLPRAGYVYGASGSQDNFGSSGYAWSSTPNGTSTGYFLAFNSSRVNPSSNDYRYLGFPVRCVRDLQKGEHGY